MQGKRAKVKNFPSEERKQSKNHCSPVKLERKKKTIKKNNGFAGRGGRGDTIDNPGIATSHLVLELEICFIIDSAVRI